MSPIIYRVTKDGNPAEITVHLGRMKNKKTKKQKTRCPSVVPCPRPWCARRFIFFGPLFPCPILKAPLSKVMIGAFTVESIDRHKRGVGAASLTNFQYHLKLQGYPTQMDIWRHVNASLNAEKWLLPTVLLYCRRTLQHLTHAEISSVPAVVSSHFHWACLVLFFSAFIFITSD